MVVCYSNCPFSRQQQKGENKNNSYGEKREQLALVTGKQTRCRGIPPSV